MSGKQLWHQTAQRWMKSNVKYWSRKWEELHATEQYRWDVMALVWGVKTGTEDKGRCDLADGV